MLKGHFDQKVFFFFSSLVLKSASVQHMFVLFFFLQLCANDYV